MEQAKSIKLMKSLSIIFSLALYFAGCAKNLPRPSEEVKSILVIPAEVVKKAQIERKYDNKTFCLFLQNE
jgi:PBP1b-binding outer membrane lipoprotein LpoB